MLGVGAPEIDLESGVRRRCGRGVQDKPVAAGTTDSKLLDSATSASGLMDSEWMSIKMRIFKVC